MLPPYEKLELPTSYAKLELPHIRLSHHPASSAEVTPVIVIYLNRPKNSNAFTGQMQDSLVRVYQLVNQDDRVRAVVLTGDGKMFCAGADLQIGFLGSGEGRAKQERDIDHRDG